MHSQPSTWWGRSSVTGWTPLGLQGLGTDNTVTTRSPERASASTAGEGLKQHSQDCSAILGTRFLV